MSKKVYLTLYKSEKYGDTFSSYVIASSKKDALSKIKLRNIGETLEDAQPINIHAYDVIDAVAFFDSSKYKSCLHAVTFMAFVLSKAGKINAQDVLADQGIVHEILHVHSNVYKNQDAYLKEVIRKDLVIFQKLFDEISH
jgi:hypothetical protein